MFKKIIGLVLGISLMCGVALAAEPGDKGVSYKGKVAYCMGVTASSDSRSETWLLREGDQEDWDAVKAAMHSGLVALYMQYHYEGTWYHRAIIQVGWQMSDSGWQRISDLRILKDPNAVMSFQYGYWFFTDAGRLSVEERGLWFMEYADSSRAFIEGLLYAEARKDYDDGQMGR